MVEVYFMSDKMVAVPKWGDGFIHMHDLESDSYSLNKLHLDGKYVMLIAGDENIREVGRLLRLAGARVDPCYLMEYAASQYESRPPDVVFTELFTDCAFNIFLGKLKKEKDCA